MDTTMLTYAIADLKRGAVMAGDWKMVAICERALGAGKYEVGASYVGRMSEEEADAGRSLTVAQAVRACSRVIESAKACE